MSRFYNTFDYDMQERFDEDTFSWNNQGPQNPEPPVRHNMYRNHSRPCYNDAYGDYQGGYGPGGGYGPRPLFIPPMPYTPPTPRVSMWGRGVGPRGPSRRNPDHDKAIKYLMRCGVTKDNLKNLPNDLLRLIQPEYCGLCDFTIDSFAISRMHYISKNHLKNQKKWLTKSQGVFQNIELPLKSRDLYCELCDIQITSKAHGDAHYDGKPHHGIVEGRKKPKNPLLLQSGMQKRLEQLIRREKRFLKSTKGNAEDEAKPEKEVKIISPELYCNICKTAVTCSEQMTMHMNGKRHLSKEKQHILNMMKGNVENENEEHGGEDEAVEDNTEEGEAADVVLPKDNTEEGEAADVVLPQDAIDEDIAAGDDWGSEAWDTQETAEA